MKVRDIFDFLNHISPFEKQESWDNSGLQIGRLDSEVKKIALSLEADLEVVEKLDANTLLITHHPLIFRSLKQLDLSHYPAKIIEGLVKKDITLISMHTNFDLTHLNLFLTSEILGFGCVDQENGICYAKLEDPMNLEELSSYVKTKLGVKDIKGVDCKKEISEIAVVCGAGFSLFTSLKKYQNLCFLTGDIKYHEAMLAKAMGVNLLDIGHYESERHFAEVLQRILQKNGYEAIIINSKNPFQIL